MTLVQPFDLIIFGGSGDLAIRKLLPALYHRHKEGQLTADGRIIGAARSDLNRDSFRALVQAGLRQYLNSGEYSEADWTSFAERLDYVQVDATDPDDFRRLAAAVTDGQRVRVFYLSTAPDFFTPICEGLAAVGLVDERARVVLEKPLGRDLASAQQINRVVRAVFEERQIYRIDHYLGKETVQNLLALRFGNVLFEPLWRRDWIRDVQITVAERIGVEGRGEFYDRTGVLRDMVQNHLLQLLCILAMEPSSSIHADAVRDEKIKVIRALRPLVGAEALSRTVRGQYRAGAIVGQPVPGYLDEEGIPPDSTTETFVAIKAEINTWRWAGVPFFLRTGKRMQEKLAEIVINFRAVPHAIFEGAMQPNRLVLRLQPDEGVKLFLMAKAPGDEMRLKPVHLNLDFAETFKTRQIDAYERLLMDVLRGNLTLFLRGDELEEAWRWAEPILHAWECSGEKPKPYIAGTWGPSASTVLLGRDGFTWHEED